MGQTVCAKNDYLFKVLTALFHFSCIYLLKVQFSCKLMAAIDSEISSRQIRQMTSEMRSIQVHNQHLNTELVKTSELTIGTCNTQTPLIQNDIS